MRKNRFAAAALAVACAAAAAPARAGGVYVFDRGARPMGRAGAFVAGADDLSAIWYNPAGLAEAGTRVAGDLGYVHMTSSWTREMRIVDADGTIRDLRSPRVDGVTSFLPIPSFAFSFPVDREKRLTFAAGMTLPYVALPNYPETLPNGQPSPTRNPQISFDLTRSFALYPGAWIAYKASPKLFVGGGVQILTGVVGARARFTAYLEDRVIGPPEMPERDSYADLTVGPFIAPSANVGVTAIPLEQVRLGVSFQAPTRFSAPFEISARLPPGMSPTNSPVPGEGTFAVTLPPIARAGIELRPAPNLRGELAYVREFWSMHDAISVEARRIDIGAALGSPRDVSLASFDVQRGFVDSNSFRAGGEWRVKVADGFAMDLRGGAAYETSAVPAGYVSTLSLDADKVMISAGGGLVIGDRLRLDGSVSHAFWTDVNVAPGAAQIHRIDPFGGVVAPEATNGGLYQTAATLIAVGAELKLDPKDPKPKAKDTMDAKR